MLRAEDCVRSQALYLPGGLWRGGLSGVLGASEVMLETSSSFVQAKRLMTRVWYLILGQLTPTCILKEIRNKP